jgi:predicted amidophosphoribosyltransferase
MVCLVCCAPTRAALCRRCSSQLRPGTDRQIGSRLPVHVALAHEGPARVLVRRLKYEAVRAAAGPLADAMARRVPDPGGIVVPIPRVPLRAWRYGIDPAKELARAYAARVGATVVEVLTPVLWAPRHAGRARRDRSPVHFRVRGGTDGPVVLVDDVVTTGQTLQAASEPARAVRAIAATGAGRVRT